MNLKSLLKRTLVLFLLLTSTFLFACRDAPQDDDPDDVVQSGGDIDTVVYLRDRISIVGTNNIRGLWIRNNQIYYTYFMQNAENIVQLVVTSMLMDGTDKRSVEVSVGVEGFLSLYVTEDEDVKVLSSDSNGLIYFKFDLSGQEQRDLHHFYGVAIDKMEQQLESVVFTECEKIVIALSGNRVSEVLILDIGNDSVVRMQFNERPFGIVDLGDGQIIVGFDGPDGNNFRMINTTSATVEITYQTNIYGLLGMLSGESDPKYDILFYDNSNLYACSLETGDRITVLNWVESGLVSVSDASVDILPDGRIIVYFVNFDNGQWETNLYILTPSLREDIENISEVTTLTLGGYYISNEIRQAVIEFNAINNGIQIRIHDLLDDAGGDWEAALLRFHTEILTGRGPDIIYDPDAALSDRGFLVDLYTYLDEDSGLSRTDFLPNALKTMEASDGSLTTVSSSFAIITMIGRADIVGHIRKDLWTPQIMLGLMDEYSDTFAPFGLYVDRENFIRMMIQYSGDDLIDWGAGEAHLDSEKFINILKIATRLHSFDDIFNSNDDEIADDLTRLQRRQIPLIMNNLWNPDDYQMNSLILGDVHVLGFPTFEGGRTILQLNEGQLGINVSSKHKDEAWSFIRCILLPSNEAVGGIPVRVDLLESKIYEAMTPIMDDDDEDEVPRFSFYDPIIDKDIPIYAMTQDEADAFRLIINSAEPNGRWVSGELWNRINHDLYAFFAGNRTVSDTTRIMQNRFQTYLNERG